MSEAGFKASEAWPSSASRLFYLETIYNFLVSQDIGIIKSPVSCELNEKPASLFYKFMYTFNFLLVHKIKTAL